MMGSDRNYILYELYVFSEWKPEPDFVQTSENLLPWSLNSLLKWIPFMGPEKSMLDDISFYKDHQERWQIALSEDGKVIAVLTDNILEIRIKRSDYATIAARTTVARDGNPQWRRIVWSQECSFLALAHSNGTVSFYDLTATNIFSISADCSRPGGLECTGTTHALSAIIFAPMRTKDNKWTSEVLLITHDGKLRCYLLSPIDGAKLHHTFTFPGGVSSAVYCAAHNLLITAGLPNLVTKDSSSATSVGISAWRVLNVDPFYKLSVASDQLEVTAAGGLQYYFSLLSSAKSALVVKMEISPDSTKLVCLHTDGEISLWRLPLLKVIRRWRLSEQPQYDVNSPFQPQLAKNNNKDVQRFFAPADMNWWSSSEIILSRFSGAVSICGIADMCNILGKEVEFLQGVPQVTQAHDNAFLALECESKVLSANQLRDGETSEQTAETEETSSGIAERSKELVKSILFTVTDLERFQPKPKKITVVSRIYRLMGIKSTTPDELFKRKIECGSYDEALKLAHTFQLDSDLVYQQQWRKTPVSGDAIYKYLAKVSKKIWVVHQCVDRLPETLNAAKELLKFGLELTNAEILEEVNRGIQGDEALTDHEDITLENLNAHTSELLRCRHVMLFYSERLALYESILKSEKSKYDRDEYHRLRSNSVVHSCVELAKEGRIAALSCLWSQLESVHMQLYVLDHVPETLHPRDYQHLLPVHAVLTEKQIAEMVTTQNSDWCRKPIFRSIWSSTWSEDTTPEGNPSDGLTIEELGKWYEKRARQIEERSGLASNALDLVRMASDNNLPNLEEIMFNLTTLDVLLYDVGCEDVTLSKVERMDSIKTCMTLTSKSTLETFVDDLKLYVIPYLRRREEFSNENQTAVQELCNFLEKISEDDLSYVLAVLKSASELELDARTQVEIAERCLLAHTSTSQLHIACDVLTCVCSLQHSDSSMAPSELLRRVDSLEKLLNACNTLSCHAVHTTLAELRHMQTDHKKANMLLTKMARNMAVREETPQQHDWEMLLSDILELREIFFTCVEKRLCYEVYASALMTSGNIATIKLASGVMTLEAETANKANLVPYTRAVDLVLQAAEEYFNSASSLQDPSLQLACACLNLIRDENRKIQAELDLIASLEILHSFGLSVLPIQVRLCKDRMSLIEDCLSIDRSAYLASHKLLTLAKLLRVAGNDDHLREGAVLQRVAECGLAAGGALGGGAAASAARRLAELRHAPAAALLSHVAVSPHTDRHLRRFLLDAALALAQTPTLENILKARLSLELEDVTREIGEKAQAVAEERQLHTADSTEDDFSDAIQTPVFEEKSFTPASELMKVGNLLVEQLWKTKLSFGWMDRSQSEEPEEETRSVSNTVNCLEFYAGLYPEYAVSDVAYRYDKFAAPSTQSLPVARWLYVGACLDNSTSVGLESEVMQRCGADVLWSDTALSVACGARALASPDKTSQLTEKASEKAIAAAAVCVQLYALLLQYNEYTLGEQTFLTRPVQLARLMLGETDPPLPRRAISDELGAVLMTCLDRLLAAVECTKLRSFGLVVDTHLFHDDPDYRTQTIYRLARCNDRAAVEYACMLAAKYDVEAARVWCQQASALVLRPGTAPDLAARLTNTAMLDALRGHADIIEEELWDQISGSDHAALIAYFTLLRHVEEKWTYANMSTDEHIRLLKKVKSASPELDYKLLLSQPTQEALRVHLLHVLRPENVGLVTKVLRTLPPAVKLPLAVSSVYTLWLTDLFFSVGSSATSKKWMQQYRQCASYFNKLSPSDLRTVIQNTCFTDMAIQRVPANTRILMIMQAVDYCQQEQENDFKTAARSEASWSEAGQELMRWARFLENFYSSTVQAILEKTHTINKDVWISLEKSRGDSQEATRWLSQLVLSGLAPASLLTLLQCLHVDLSMDQFFDSILDMDLDEAQMQTVVSCMLHYNKGSDAVSERVVEKASSRAARLRLQPHLHISLLSLSQNKQLNETGLENVTQYSLQLLQSEWGEDMASLSESNLKNEDCRRDVFLKCMKTAETWQRKKALVDLLSCWPAFTRDERNPCFLFVEWLLSDIDHQAENGVLIKLLLKKPVFSYEQTKALTEKVEPETIENLLWILLMNKGQRLQDDIPSVVRKLGTKSINLSDDIIKELLDNKLFIQLVGTTAYTPILNYIMNNQADSGDLNTYSVSWAVQQLTKANFIAEAGQLMLLSAGVPAALRSFSESIKYHKNNLFS